MKTSGMIAILVLAFGAGTGLSSCKAVRGSPGADGTSYSLFTLDGILHGSPQQVVQAAESVLKEMDLRVITSSASGVDGKLVARTALDSKIEIRIEREDEKLSTIAIRVDTFGDRSLSREIYDRIKAKLP